MNKSSNDLSSPISTANLVQNSHPEAPSTSTKSGRSYSTGDSTIVNLEHNEFKPDRVVVYLDLERSKKITYATWALGASTSGVIMLVATWAVEVFVMHIIPLTLLAALPSIIGVAVVGLVILILTIALSCLHYAKYQENKALEAQRQAIDAQNQTQGHKEQLKKRAAELEQLMKNQREVNDPLLQINNLLADAINKEIETMEPGKQKEEIGKFLLDWFTEQQARVLQGDLNKNASSALTLVEKLLSIKNGHAERERIFVIELEFQCRENIRKDKNIAVKDNEIKELKDKLEKSELSLKNLDELKKQNRELQLKLTQYEIVEAEEASDEVPIAQVASPSAFKKKAIKFLNSISGKQ